MGTRPAPQVISRLLRRAGFIRSTYGDTGVDWLDATRGYRVWRTFRREVNGETVTAVMHVDKGAHELDAEEDAHQRIVRAELAKYATAIQAAGFSTEVHEIRDSTPWLFVLGAEDANGG